MAEVGEARRAMLQRLRLIFARTSEGPWKSYQDGVHPVEVGGMDSGEDYAICTHGPKSYQNADWIVAIHNDWPMVDELLAELMTFDKCSGCGQHDPCDDRCPKAKASSISPEERGGAS